MWDVGMFFQKDFFVLSKRQSSDDCARTVRCTSYTVYVFFVSKRLPNGNGLCGVLESLDVDGKRAVISLELTESPR